MMLSRRQFLQAAGITVAAAYLPRFAPIAPRFDAVFGRALSSVSVHAIPSSDAPLVTHLWSDAVTPILDASGAWYRLPEGYARREGLQPMIAPARRSAAPAAPPFWGEVTGAVAIVRAYCAADAPISARIGHGGVLRVVDYLPGDGIDWYGVAEGDDLLGWTQTAVWSPARIDSAAPALSLAIDPAAQRLTVYDGGDALLTAPISTGRELPPGAYPLTEQQAVSARQDDYRGVPWTLRFGDDLRLTGAYWHNHFGTAAPGAAVQVTPPLAQWLYSRAAEIIIS